MSAKNPLPPGTAEFTARQRAAMRAAIEVPLTERDRDRRLARILQFVAAAYSTPSAPSDAPIDPVDLVRWFVGMFAGRGVDLDQLAGAAEADLNRHLVGYAYAGMEGSC